MTNIILIAFIITLVQLGLSKRLSTYIRVLSIQGILLFGVAFIELIEINVINLLFVLLETVVFKTLMIPYFLSYIIKKIRLRMRLSLFCPTLCRSSLSQASLSDHFF